MTLQYVVFVERDLADVSRRVSWTQHVAMRGNGCVKDFSGTT